MKILVVKLSSIGDIIHTLPVLSAIQKALPKAEITWVAEKKSAEILRGNPLIKLIEVDTKSLRKADSFGKNFSSATQNLRELRSVKFDVALDFQGLLKSAAIAKLAKAKRRFGFAKKSLREPASRFLLTETFEMPSEIHIIRKNLMLAEKALGISVPAENFDFPIFTDEIHQHEADKIISQVDESFALLNPAGGWVTKLWQAEKFGELADKIWLKNGLKSIVATAPNEKKLADKVLNSSKSGKIISATPSLKGFYELAKRAQIYVGGDTGPTHLAVAAKTPLVGIFGPTEWWRNGSPNAADICVERNDIGCRTNCHRRTCSNWICLDISVETVFRAVQRRLQSKM
jgi:lipopolysaccharide heptosyltransferase I